MADLDAGQGQGETSGQRVLSGLLKARDQARLADGAAPSLPHPQPATVKRAALNAIGRAFERLYKLPASPLELSPAAITLAEMAELLPQPALLSVVEGAGEAIGVVAICPSLMTALIEMQTIGRITSRPVETRRSTRSDAIICADFVNALLSELGGEITRIDGFENFGGFRYASFLEDQRPLLLMLEDCPYRSLAYTVKVGGEPGREGKIFVALPQKTAVAALAPPSPAEAVMAAPATDESDRPAPDLTAPMAQAPIEVVGVLCRRSMRLGDLRDLRAGQVLPLPRVDLSHTRLETRLGQLLATGKLGESEGYHAIRLRREGEQKLTGGDDQQAGKTNDQAASTASGLTAHDVIANGTHPALAPEPPMADLSLPDRFRTGTAVPGDAKQPPPQNSGTTVAPAPTTADAPQKSANTG
ncbi:FliM/FliN family flagellar motor switch protein [Paracoccus tegillarcae]|uniref:Flagellar motor switch protein FliN-like C-terminal domain-containing protein n=1 Tax=Paracoccus tegillarcae TaxID=1529068 RepID=A0A2K9EBQ9_9RHOB|nr:flagellar motor switch protein FliM [Paracoccus tegillarcae]AUH32338.1 hypothetical protein CUV01_02075 [Paracoccus tegillarcae]